MGETRFQDPRGNGHINQLLDKVQQHTITLPEAYELRTWLQTVILNESTYTWTEKQQHLFALLVLNAVQSLIYELEKSDS